MPNNPDRSDTLYLNSHRYVTTLVDLNDVFDAILQHFIDKFSEILTRQEGSGFIIDKILQFNINYHKCVAYIRPGNRIKFPMKRGGRLIFNPPKQNNNDNYCLLKCISAHMIKQRLVQDGDGIVWRNISRLLRWLDISQNIKITTSLCF